MLAPPSEPSSETLELNARVADYLTGLPPIWEVGHEAARLAREEGTSVFGPLTQSERARSVVIDGPGGPIHLRVFEASQPKGVFLHIHGGGWVLGGAHHHDKMLEALADATEQTVVSVDYRLAPEHPHPAANADCETAALWLVENAVGTFGTATLTIGGESAGAHLAMTTMLRLRDRHGVTPFLAANLVYGWYDLRLSPSARRFGDAPSILTTPLLEWFVDQYRPEDLCDPDASPIMADLEGLPPAMFTVGDLDPLLDDTLFMAARWSAAGIETVIDLWPGGIHAFDYFDTGAAAAARSRMHHFLRNGIEPVR